MARLCRSFKAEASLVPHRTLALDCVWSHDWSFISSVLNSERGYRYVCSYREASLILCLWRQESSDESVGDIFFPSLSRTLVLLIAAAHEASTRKRERDTESKENMWHQEKEQNLEPFHFLESNYLHKHAAPENWEDLKTRADHCITDWSWDTFTVSLKSLFFLFCQF